MVERVRFVPDEPAARNDLGPNGTSRSRQINRKPEYRTKQVQRDPLPPLLQDCQNELESAVG